MAGFGGSVKLKGETEYRKALKDITTNLTVLSSEMKVVNSVYDKNDSSINALKSRNEVLNKTLDEQTKKLNEAKKMLNEAKTSTDSNATTVAKWQTEVNKAQAEVNKTTNEIKKNEETMRNSKKATGENTDSIKEFANEEEKAGQNTLKLGDLIKANLLSDAIKSGLSALVSGMKKIGSTLLDVGKQALDSYADYEQLIGGVETLFKDNAGVVEGYANNAYKTAGLSANNYMETVTSFSASLLQSLNNDTAKSAEVADMAITDMADNANKMGTDMSMIQNAYQGFAKQNYTMLDNLKLGYGGTKSEMERLLQDATKISGVKYDISSLNDVYQAIHVIQGELGITGTTALEASTTIQGSVNSMKSAWQNMLTGISDDNANFDLLMDNFVDSLVTALNNILPRVEIILQGLVDLILTIGDTLLPQLLPIISNVINNLITTLQGNLPTLLDSLNQITTTLINAIITSVPQLIPIAVQMIMTIADTLIQNLPQILQAGITIIVSLIQGLAQSLPTLIPTIINAVVLMVETLIDNIDLIIDAGIQLILGLADGLIQALPDLIDKIPEIIDKLIIAITDNLPKLLEAGIILIIKLAEGLIKAIPQLISKIPQIIGSLLSGIANYYSKLGEAGKDLLIKIKDGIVNGIQSLPEVGKNLVQGLWNGISNNLQWIKDKITGWVGNVVSFIKNLFGIHSPSTLFRDEIGTNLALGLGEGFEDTMSDVNKQMANAIQTDYDLNVNSTLSGTSTTTDNNYNEMLNAFKEALKEVKIVMDDREMGTFVTDTMERAVFN